MKILKYKYNGKNVYIEYSRIDTIVISNGFIVVTFIDDTDREYNINHNLTREDFTKKFENWLIDNQTIFDVDLVLNVNN